MRVLYSFPHRLGRHGIGTVAAAQVEGLMERDVEVTLYCASCGSEMPKEARVVRTMVVGGRRVPHRAVGLERSYRYHDWRVARAVVALQDRVDLVHCWPGACCRTLEAARGLGIPTVREVPSAHTAAAYESAEREALALGLELPASHSHHYDADRLAREEREFRLADTLLVPSMAAEQTFLDRGFDSSQLVRHQYGYDPARFRPAPANRGAADRRFTALFVARGEPNKGLHYALRAWLGSGAAENGRFLICGEILPTYRTVLAPDLAHPSVEQFDQVREVASVMQETDVLLLPSVTEGSALVTYEAQGCGCVLLVSDAAGAHVTHLQEALVHPVGDVSALTEHLRLLHENRELLARMRAATLANAERLTWERAVDRLLDIYRSRLGNKGLTPT